MLYKILDDKTEIKIGQSAKENWDLIEKSNPDWYWFHLKSFPSSHVVLCSSQTSEQNLALAAQFCKQTTKYKNVPNIKVSYCKINNLNKADKIGSVTYISKRKVKEIKP
jgi:predicted ribosome quality control (RQC) complex YloA/Tae2 family protein